MPMYCVAAVRGVAEGLAAAGLEGLWLLSDPCMVAGMEVDTVVDTVLDMAEVAAAAVSCEVPVDEWLSAG